MNRNSVLVSGFLNSASRFPERPALEVEGRVLKYQELQGIAGSLAATLLQECPWSQPPLTAVFAYRSVTAFAGVDNDIGLVDKDKNEG